MADNVTTAGFRVEDGVPYVGDKAFPWAVSVRNVDRDLPDYSYRTRGFHLLFENGWTLSVQFGVGNYCDNRDAFWDGEGVWHEVCPTAEIACWDRHHKWWDFGDDEVKGWQTPEDVLRWIEFFSTQPSDRVDA